MQKMPASPLPSTDFSQEIPAYVSVDVEASGPSPGRYSLLSIGACTVARPQRTFYVELKPVSDDFTPEAMAVNGLSLAELAVRGLSPTQAMASFESWLQDSLFERINIKAETKDEYCRILSQVMREKALSAMKGPTYQLIEVKFGSYPCEVVSEGRTFRAGSPIA